MTAQVDTVIVIAPSPQVFDYLANPRHLRQYLIGMVPTADDAQDASAADMADAIWPGCRWAFHAEPAAHRLHWRLLAPCQAQGTLDVYGDCSVSQLWLTVQTAPPAWPPAHLHELMRAVLHRIRECIEDDVTHRTRPVQLRSA